MLTRREQTRLQNPPRAGKLRGYKVRTTAGKWCYVDALDRSDARAQAKALFGVPRQGRLPAGTTVSEVPL